MPWRDKDLLIFLTANATWKHYCEVLRKMIFKTVSGSGTNVSQSAQLHKESISKATPAASPQISKFCFHRAIPGIKLSHLLCMHNTVICGLSGSTILFHIISQTARFSGGGDNEHKMCVLMFSITFVWNISHPKKNEGNILKNVHWSSCKVLVILVRF